MAVFSKLCAVTATVAVSSQMAVADIRLRGSGKRAQVEGQTSSFAAEAAGGNPSWCSEVPPAYLVQAGCTGGATGSTAGLPALNLAASEGSGNPKWCEQVPPAYLVQAGCTGGAPGAAGAGGLPALNLAASEGSGNPKWCEQVPPAYLVQAGCTGGAPGAAGAGGLPALNLAASEGSGNPKWCEQVPPAYLVQAGCTGGAPGAAGVPGTAGVALAAKTPNSDMEQQKDSEENRTPHTEQVKAAGETADEEDAPTGQEADGVKAAADGQA